MSLLQTEALFWSFSVGGRLEVCRGDLVRMWRFTALQGHSLLQPRSNPILSPTWRTTSRGSLVGGSLPSGFKSFLEMMDPGTEKERGEKPGEVGVSYFFPHVQVLLQVD